MRKELTICIIIIFLLPVLAFAEAWRVDLQTVSGGLSLPLILGTSPYATDSYDMGLDVNLPIPPPINPYAYFPISDPMNPYVSMLTTDIRGDSEELYTWQVMLMRGVAPQVLYWNPDLLPRGDFRIAVFYPGEYPTVWQDMRSISSLEFAPAQMLEIQYSPDGIEGTSPPYVSEWDPLPGSEDNYPNTPISVTIMDDETGVNIESLHFFVEGEEVTEDLSIAKSSGEYSLYYSPDEPYPLNSWVEVRVVVNDLAYPPNTLDHAITFKTLDEPSYVTEWEVPLTVWSTMGGADTAFFPISYGGDPAASDGFDYGFDTPLPPPPPGMPYAYFPISDPEYSYFTMLFRDIHNSALNLDYWKINIGSGFTYNGVNWNPEMLPTGYTFMIGSAYPADIPETWFDMSAVNSLTGVLIGEVIWIKSIRAVVDSNPPVIYNWNPENGAMGISVSANISVFITDYETGVDLESIVMHVNSTDVSSALIIEEYEDYIWVYYDPPVDFPQISAIEVVLDVLDLASPPNWATSTLRFTTGYFVAPEWMDTLFVWTTPDPFTEPTRFELVFGADEVGTELFDAGLDMLSPPMPPGDNPYTYFVIDDPDFPNLLKDIRYSLAESLYWEAYMLYFPYDEEAHSWLTWYPELLPEEGNFYIGFTDFISPPSEWLNMRRNSSLDFVGIGRAIIHFWLTGPDRWCLSGFVNLSDGSDDLYGSVISCPELEISATTDSTGFYELCDIPSGIYQFYVSRNGYETVSLNIAILSDVYHDFELNPLAYTISGTVVLDGLPEEHYEGTMVTLNGDTAYTNEDGYYIFYNIVPGEYPMSFYHLGFFPYDTTIAVINDDLVVNTTLIAQRGSIYGLVTLEGEDPLEGTMVLMNGVDTFYTNIFGEFLYTNLVMHQTYLISLRREGYEALDTNIYLDEEEEVLNIFLRFQRYDITGTIYLSDEPATLEGSMIRIEDGFIDSVITAEDGYYGFLDNLPGEYHLYLRKPGYIPQDTIIYLDDDLVLDFTLIAYAGDLNPPLNLTVINGLEKRVPMYWDAPESSEATLEGYIIYRGTFSVDSIGYVPGWVRSFIDHNVDNWDFNTYWVRAKYAEGYSDLSNWAIGNPRPNSTDPLVLVYDFDNSARLCSGGTEGVEASHVRMLEAFEVPYQLTGQDVSLSEYRLIDYLVVFVGTGIYDSDQTKINTQSLRQLAAYLHAGGRIYWEGADFGYDYFRDTHAPQISRYLYQMFGVEFLSDGNPDRNVQWLEGQDWFFDYNLELDYPVATIADRFIDEIGPDGADMVMFSFDTTFIPDSATGRMGAYQVDNYRTVHSTIYLGAIEDGPFPHTQYMALGTIFEYLTGINVLEGVKPLNVASLPTHYDLAQNYPNPFNLNTYIGFSLKENTRAELTICDIMGKEVKVLFSQSLPAGHYIVEWDGTDAAGREVSTGIYFYTLKAGNEIISKRLTMLK
ncbi:T9SS type A sorting domain-containing protein [bacterium]|nr:T9SS type A sorting domain-containing protein [bacterium]